MRILNLTFSLTAAITMAVVASQAAMAATSAAPASASTTVASIPMSEAAPKKALPIGISFVGDFYGPEVTSITSDETSGGAIDARAPLFLRGRPTVKYTIDKNHSVSLIPDFNYQLTSIEPNSPRELTWNNSYIKIKKDNLANGTIVGNSAKLDSQLRLLLPTSKGTRLDKGLGSVQFYLNPSMQIAKSRFSFEVTNFAEYFLQTQDMNAKGTSALKQSRLYTGPQLNYQMTGNASAFILYEAYVYHNTLGQPQNTYSPSKSAADLEPGLSIDITKNVNLSPYLNWYTNQSIKTTSFNLNASVTLL